MGLVLVLALAQILSPATSEAQQVLYWDRDPIVDGVQDGGNGSIWDAANRANWLPSPGSPSTQNTTWPGDASGFDTIAAFGNGGVLDSRDMRVVNVSGTVNAGGLLFRPITLGPAEGAPPSATLYTSYGLVGGVISLAENANIEIGENTSSMSLSQRVTLVSQIAGHNINITRTAGATDWGFLEVRGPNTWTGTLNVGPQVFLELRAVAASNTLTSVNVADSTTLSLFYTAGGDSNYTNAISLTGEGFGGRGALRFDETLTQSGNITLMGDASIGTGASNFTGTITGSIGESGGSRVLKINGNGIGGKIILQGNNTFTGGVEILAGTLRITGDSSLGAVPGSVDANNITMNGGILQLGGSFNINANRGILLQTRGGTIDTEAQNTTYAGSISGNGPLSKAGTGTLTLSGANTYSGETRVLGVLVVANDQALGDSSQGTIVSGSIGRLELTGGVTVTGESLITPTLSNLSGNNVWDGSVQAAVGIVMVLESKKDNLLISGNVSAQSTDGIDRSLTLQGAGDAEISGSLTRAINFTKSEVGTWRLSGNNTFTSLLTINAGTVVLAHAGAMNAAAPNAISFANNALDKTLAIEISTTVGGLGAAGGTGQIITESRGAQDVNLRLAGSGSHTYMGILRDGAGAGKLGLTRAGTGTQILTAANTYTGATTLDGGTLELGFNVTGAATSNIVHSSSNLIAAGGKLTLTGGKTTPNSQTFNGLTVASGYSTITLTRDPQNAQDLVLILGAISRTGGSINFVLPSGPVSATNGIRATGTLTNGILGGWATVGSANWATLSSGNIVANTTHTDITQFSTGGTPLGPLPDNANANVRIITGGNSGNIALADAGGDGVTQINTLLHTGTGTAMLDFGASPSGKTLRLGATGGIMMTSSSGALTIGVSNTEGSILTAGGATTNTAGELYLYNHHASNLLTINSRVTDNGTGAVTLIKNGAGTLVLRSTSNSYSGGTVVNGGILQAFSDEVLGASVSTVPSTNITLDGGTLQWGAKFDLSANRGIYLGEGGGTLDTNGGGVADLNYVSTFVGIISGSGALTKTGNGAMTLNQANTYTGETVVTGGTLVVGHTNALGTSGSAVKATGAAALVLANNVTVSGKSITISGNGFNTNGCLQVAAGGQGVWAGEVIIGATNSRIGTATNSQLTISGSIRNNGTTASNLEVAAHGTGGVVVVAGTNTYTGTTGVVRGTLRLGADNSLPTGTVLSLHKYDTASTPEHATFDLAGNDQTIAGLESLARTLTAPTATSKTSVTNSTSQESILTVNQSTNTNYIGEITGVVQLIKSGTGTLTLTHQAGATSNTYSGKTTIAAGTLALGTNGTIDGTPWVQINTGALLSISGRTAGTYTFTNKVLSGTGSVNGTLVVSGTTVIRPGSTGTAAGGFVADAGTGFGELTFTNLTVAPKDPSQSARIYLQLAGTTSNTANGAASTFANASSGGYYDTIEVTGTLGLNAGSRIEVTYAQGYVAGWGDVFNLIDWVGLNLDADGVGTGAGAFTLADLDISGLVLATGLEFATDRFLADGIIYVVPEPSRVLLVLLGTGLVVGRRRR